MSEKQKIVIKTESLLGVDMSVNNLEFFTSVRIKWTKVSHTLTKKSGVTFIGTKEQLLPGDVIQVGNLGIKYKVVSLKRLEAKPQGYIYRIKRVDGANITSLDIDNILVGQKVHIVSNKTFHQIFNQHPDIPQFEDVREPEIPDTEFSCPPRPIIVTPQICGGYTVTFFPEATAYNYTLSYVDCSGITIELEGIVFRNTVMLNVCTKDATSIIVNNIGSNEIIQVENCI